ncbi:restriction endonuclease subunit S [Desulfosporosinus sp. Sb-LF]|uniref:restriction endonuclease subunit S n=1 Tax=Desulfosporosinus sp. Sb-LF TaxID=2560027 RepID=UPI00107FBC20|nr:restriction endonuclease subunit S [Desulfosporosinus sp. Sb-LF]TGE31459.1 restriction endonuclease subunit S [Desulfosporosinus sp. Sb-LF]
MSAKLTTYEKYQPTNLPWLPQIPGHWTLLRNKTVLKECKTTVGEKSSEYTLLSLTVNGVIVRDIESGKGKFPKDFGNYKVVEKDDIIFCLFDLDETPRTVGLSRFDGMITGAYDVFKIQGIIKRYLYYYYLSLDNVKALKPLYTGLRKVINVPVFLGAKLPVPPHEEQEQIVRYLDSQTSKIKRFIKAKKKQIAFLKEQRVAEINHAATKGVNTAVKMKPSYVNWLGDIPEHWEVVQSKRLFTQRKEKAHSDDVQLTASQKYGIIEQGEFMRLVGRRVTVVLKGSDILKHVDLNDFLSLACVAFKAAWSIVKFGDVSVQPML